MVSVLEFEGKTEYIHNTHGIIVPTQHSITFPNSTLNFEVMLSHMDEDKFENAFNPEILMN